MRRKFDPLTLTTAVDAGGLYICTVTGRPSTCTKPSRVEVGRGHHDGRRLRLAVAVGVEHVADVRARELRRHRRQARRCDGRRVRGILRAAGPGVLAHQEPVLQRVPGADVGERAVAAQRRGAAEHERAARRVGVAERVERRARLAVAGVDVEHLDLLPVREGVGAADHLVRAQVQAEAVPDVLPAGLATVGLRLGDDRLPAELHLGVDVRALGQLDVEERRERRAPEVGRQVRQDVVAGPVGGRGAERVVLQPVGVERRDDGAGIGCLVVARRDPAADGPDAEEREDVAPEPVRDRVLPGRDDSGPRLAPARLERGDGELSRLRVGSCRGRGGFSTYRSRSSGPPSYSLSSIVRTYAPESSTRATASGAPVRSPSATSWNVSLSAATACSVARSPVDRYARSSMPASGSRYVVTQRSPQGSADLVCHGLSPPDACRHVGVPARTEERIRQEGDTCRGPASPAGRVVDVRTPRSASPRRP